MNHRLSYSVNLARACTALAVAYALALQVLLASVMAAGLAMTPQADGAVICYGGDGSQQPSHSPAGAADCVLSCAQGLSATAVLPSDISFDLLSTTRDQGERGLAAAFVVSQRSSPKLAQGPPQNA